MEKGMFVLEASKACKEFGIKFGVYLHLDRHEPNMVIRLSIMIFSSRNYMRLLTNYEKFRRYGSMELAVKVKWEKTSL